MSQLAKTRARFCCPTCGCSAPHMHPALQQDGEIELCVDDFHLRPTPQNRPEYIAAVMRKRDALVASVAPKNVRR